MAQFKGRTLKAVNNLNLLSTKIVPEAGRKAANDLKSRVMRETLKTTETAAQVEKHHIKRYFPKKLQKPARLGQPAIIHAKLADMPAINLFRKEKQSMKDAKPSAMAAGLAGRASSGVTAPGTYARSYPGAFIADGSRRQSNAAYNAMLVRRYGIKPPVLKGNPQIMRRTGKPAYPVEIVKVPLARPLRLSLRQNAVSALKRDSAGFVNRRLLESYRKHLGVK